MMMMNGEGELFRPFQGIFLRSPSESEENYVKTQLEQS
jgi:hypothetical protein